MARLLCGTLGGVFESLVSCVESDAFEKKKREEEKRRRKEKALFLFLLRFGEEETSLALFLCFLLMVEVKEEDFLVNLYC